MTAPYPISSDDAKYLDKAVPVPVFPNLEIPTPPVVPGVPMPTEDCPRMDCEGGYPDKIDVANSPVPPPLEGRDRIMIGIPLLDVKYEFFESFLRLWTQLLTIPNRKYEITYQVAYRKPVHMAEEWLVNIARYNKCTHILFMDDDVYDVTAEDVDKLYAANKDIIGGVMYASKFPHAMCVFRRFEADKKVIDMPSDTNLYRLYEVPCLCKKCGVGQSHWDGKFCPVCGEPQDNVIQEVDLIPFPLTLMKLSIFDKIKKPWFYCSNIYPTDSWFADRVLEAGLREYAHMGVRLNHAGINDFTKPHYMNMGLAKAQQHKAVVNLTPEQMDVHQRLLINKMDEAEHKVREKPPVVGEGNVQVANISEGSPMTLITHGT
jgi:hypothetical protein